MAMDTAEFGSLVRRRRREGRLTQRELALVAGVGERFVVELETGKPTCQLGKALAVAAALGIELVDVRAPAGTVPDEPEFPDVEAPELPAWRP